MAQSLGIRTGGLTTQSFSFLAKKHRLSEDEVRDLDRRYKVADLDRSGQLDKDELKVLLKATVAKSAGDAGLTKFIESQWHNVDRDGSGTVDFDEFLGLYDILKSGSGLQNKPAAAATGAAAGAASATPAKGAAAGAAPAKGAAAKKTASGAKLGVEKKKRTKKPRAKTFKPKAELTQQNYVSNEIVWSAVRTHNSFLVNRGGVVLASEPGNLRNVHSRYHSGLVNDFSVGITPIKGGFNIRRNAPSARRSNQPSRQFVNTKVRAATTRKAAQKLDKHLQGLPRQGLRNAALARISRLNSSVPGDASSKRAQRANRSGRRGNAAAAPAASTQAAPAAQATQPAQ